MNLSKYALSSVIIFSSLQLSFGASVMVVLRNTPKGADSITVTARGLSLAVPFFAFAKPDAEGNAFASFDLPIVKDLSFCALALQHNGTNVFPSILAVGGTKSVGTGSQNVIIDFAAVPFQAQFGSPSDLGDGTLALPVRFLGSPEFFSGGEVVNVSPITTNLVGSLTIYRASVTRDADPSVFNAVFRIPAQAASGRYQIGYHAIDFRVGPEIPLLTVSTFASSQSGLIQASQPAASGSGEQSSSANASSAPVTGYHIVKGKDGRLIRQPLAPPK